MKFESFEKFLEYFKINKIVDVPDFQTAMTHSSIQKKNNYERFEFLGDTILNFCISRLLFENFQNAKEGELSKKKSYLVSRKVCRMIADDICLNDKMLYQHDQNNKIDNILSDGIESLLCIIWKTYGIDKVFEIVQTLFQNHIGDEEVRNPKMELQELTQKTYGELPIYKLENKSGSEHEPIFTVSCIVQKYKSIGIGKSKKLAENQSAVEMLKYLRSFKKKK